MQTLKKKDIKNYKVGIEEEFKSKKQQKYFYAKANDKSLSDEERAKWKKLAGEKSEKTDFDEIPEKIEEEVEELDEFVNGVGAAISGDEKNVNNSEIKTAPQATTDDFNAKAIQPNRYLYNVNSVGARVMGVTGEGFDRLAKEKALSLLEGLDSDFNDNAIIDLKELPHGVARKVLDLIKSIEMNGLINNTEKVDMILNYINNKLKPNA
tara:strand:+ start:1924 stop:2550 length:627 start_codon:yes stop_codon:yes gene_type:complete